MSKIWYYLWCVTLVIRVWLLDVGNWVHARHVRAAKDEELRS